MTTHPPERLLVIGAHPGDADLALGGSVAAWVAGGSHVELVCCTSGDAAGDDAGSDPLEVAARREAQQRGAAELLGYEDVTFLHRPEGALVNDLALREQLVRLIRTFRPDALAAPDPSLILPSWGGVQDVDHREAGLAAVDAVAPAGMAMAFPHLVRSEALEPHRVERLILYWTDQPDEYADIGEQLPRKSAAFELHTDLAARPDHDAARALELDRDRGATRGVAAAEVYRLVTLD